MRSVYLGADCTLSGTLTPRYSSILEPVPRSSKGNYVTLTLVPRLKYMGTLSETHIGNLLRKLPQFWTLLDARI